MSDISTESRIVTERVVMEECLCLFVCLLHCINIDKLVLSNENREIYETSTLTYLLTYSMEQSPS